MKILAPRSERRQVPKAVLAAALAEAEADVGRAPQVRLKSSERLSGLFQAPALVVLPSWCLIGNFASPLACSCTKLPPQG